MTRHTHPAAAVLLALALGASAGQAGAQERLTLEDAVQRALQRSPQMAQANQQILSAEQTERTAWGAYLPSLSVSAGSSLRSQDRFDAATDRIVTGSADSYNAGLSARYTVYSGGSRGATRDQAGAEINAATSRAADQRWAVVLQTEETFFRALRQEELAQVATTRLSQAEESLDMTRRQAQLGMATASDTLRARLEMVNARQALLEAETGLRSARVALGRQVGEPGPVLPQAPATIEPTPLRMTVEEILAAAEATAPTVRAAEASEAAARAGLAVSRTTYLPAVSLSTGYNWANEAVAFAGGNRSWNLGLNLSYPIFNGFQREASVTRADGALVVARTQADDARLAARQEADDALHGVEAAGAAIGIAQEAVAVAAEDLRVVRERYRVGVATILQLVSSQIALDQARVDLVNARYDYVLARAGLEAVLGVPL